MKVSQVILETLGMMGFTFLVGMGVAYIIKILVEVFHFFRAGNVSSVVRDYKSKIEHERQMQSVRKKAIAMMGKDSDVELLRYMYENRNKYDVQEEVDDTYNLFNFYRGIYKDKKESDGINDLIKYYNGEV